MSELVGKMLTQECGAMEVRTFAGGLKRGRMVSIMFRDESDGLSLTLTEAKLLIEYLKEATK